MLPPDQNSEGRVDPRFLGRLTVEAVPLSGLAELTILGFNWGGGAHILHLIFSVPVGTYEPNRRVFGCRGELPLEGISAITEISVDSFVARHVISAVLQEYHRVHLEVVPPSVWRMTPYKRASGKGEGRNLSRQGLTFLPPDAFVPLICLKWSMVDFSHKFFPRLAGRKPTYDVALDWIQFAFTGDPKGQYMAPANTSLSFVSSVNG